MTVGYFEAMGIPIVRGRGFVTEDDGDSEPVMVINETREIGIRLALGAQKGQVIKHVVPPASTR